MTDIRTHLCGPTPDWLYKVQLVRRRASLWKAADLIVIHVPKNGGTSVNQALSAYWSARAGDQMNVGARITNPERYRALEFDSFDQFVVEWLDDRDLLREDPVFRPQSGFVVQRNGDIGVIHFGRLEDPASYKRFLESVLGRQVAIEHLNRTTESHGYHDAYSPETRDIVARAYSEDVHRFAYDF